MVVLNNNQISVKVDELGAELASVVLNETGNQYLWQGDEQYWANRSPLLFPIVGRLNDHQYQYDGKLYGMGIHGFARNMHFSVEQQRNEAATFVLSSNGQTKEIYPFDFVLRVNYLLEGKTVRIEAEVEHTGTSTMYFSIGFHPGFDFGLMNPGSGIDDYYLKFDARKSMADRVGIAKGYRSGTVSNGAFEEGLQPLSAENFSNDAIVIKNFSSKHVTLASDTYPHGVTMSIDGFPYLGIWTTYVRHPLFVCIEPWHGVGSKLGDNPDRLIEKEGIIALGPKGSFSCSTSITLF
ncbi:MAG: aldose 1-epimerase family protein [Sphaerochaetaceae bacterium]|jgi:galactose mutarotase-like enzyme|nr:aldose 1-epimerase family protein [Sphaerochaetaceae bacterium]NLO59980.1 aldose 1-epimerase family protein [Spirochaetales bacterium]MDD2405090.1 aldose 1-epimerase family protein [Sphaerochaetaceae bacterium]MDD3670303.1 aldose 1-epimerase family protein [Sphaerochaetaceae bacterium]MDD4258989.1 aldose 1-epimerase family protein [Sphaerochaetaceae bacterium]